MSYNQPILFSSTEVQDIVHLFQASNICHGKGIIPLINLPSTRISSIRNWNAVSVRPQEYQTSGKYQNEKQNEFNEQG